MNGHTAYVPAFEPRPKHHRNRMRGLQLRMEPLASNERAIATHIVSVQYVTYKPRKFLRGKGC